MITFEPKNIQEFSNGNFWVVYGRNGSGKTHFIGTFPGLLVICFKDQGLNTLKNVPGVEYYNFDGSPKDLCDLCEMLKNSKYQTIAFDTLGVYVDQIKEMIKKKLGKTKMEIQMWGDLGDYFCSCLMAMKELSRTKTVIVSFHEQVDKVEGYENEIVPTVTISVQGNVIAKTLCGLANYAVHTYMYDYTDPKTMKSIPYHAMHVGVNPYYWTKFQTEYKVPETIFNPSYELVERIKNGQYYQQQ